MTRKLWLLPFVALVALVGVFAACNDDDEGGGNEDDIAAVEELVSTLVGTDPTDQEQVDFFLAHMSDEVMANFFQTTKEECAASAEDCIGPPSEIDRIEGTEASDDSAQTTVYSSDGTVFTLLLSPDEDAWIVDEISFGPAQVPEGVTEIDVDMAEYNYVFEESEITDGNVGFSYRNIGEESHEVAVLKVGKDYELDAIVEHISTNGTGGDEMPPGVEGMTWFGMAPPGGRGVGVGEEPLAAGDYVMVCTFPDPEGTPHIELGMHKEFAVSE
jgi:hypothetical protein